MLFLIYMFFFCCLSIFGRTALVRQILNAGFVTSAGCIWEFGAPSTGGDAVSFAPPVSGMLIDLFICFFFNFVWALFCHLIFVISGDVAAVVCAFPARSVGRLERK